MSRSLSYLRRALFGTSCAIVFGFGASHALAAPPESPGSMWCDEAYCDDYCGRMGWDGQCKIDFCECY